MTDRECIVRPTVLGIAFDEAGLVATVEYRGMLFLPGGGIEPGETPESALHREFLEETGWSIEILGQLCEAAEHVYLDEADQYLLKEGTFFRVNMLTETDFVTEPDHVLGWVTIEQFAARAAHQSHPWAVRQAIQSHDRT